MTDGSSNETDNSSSEDFPPSTRLDITASVIAKILERDAFDGYLQALQKNTTVETIHLSGMDMDRVLQGNRRQLERLLKAIGNMPNVTEFFCFRGTSQSNFFTEDDLRWCLPPHLTVLMLWQFPHLPSATHLPTALRKLEHLQRLTIKVPPPPPHAGAKHNSNNNSSRHYPWGCLDTYAMTWASLPHLIALQCKCVSFRPHDPLLSPEALAVLLSSRSLQTLYLENCGLLDEHVDVLVEALEYVSDDDTKNNTNNNSVLQAIDWQENRHLSEDALYSTGRLLARCSPALQSLNLSGVHPITDAAATALVQGLEQNRTLVHLELEGTAERYADEFDVAPSPHAGKDWYERMDLCLRLNRAYREAPRLMEGGGEEDSGDAATDDFCAALNSVSDHASGLFHFLRKFPKYCVAISPMARELKYVVE